MKTLLLMAALILEPTLGFSAEVKTDSKLRKPASGAYYCNGFKKFHSENLESISVRIAGGCNTALPHVLVKMSDEKDAENLMYCCTSP